MKETNMEHFRGEIKALGYDLAAKKGVVKRCDDILCKECDFSKYKNNDELGCSARIVKWLMSEYKPEPVLTAREKHFVECIEDGWLTKSKSNIITWWEKKPSRDGKHRWIVTDTSGFVYLQEIHPCAIGDMFPFITWEDEEPWAVADLRKLKALEYNPEDVAFKDGTCTVTTKQNPSSYTATHGCDKVEEGEADDYKIKIVSVLRWGSTSE